MLGLGTKLLDWDGVFWGWVEEALRLGRRNLLDWEGSSGLGGALRLGGGSTRVGRC